MDPVKVAKTVAMEVAENVAIVAIVAAVSMKTVLTLRLDLLVFVLASVSAVLIDLDLEIIFVSFLVFLLLPDQPKIIFDETFWYPSTRSLLLYSELGHT